ncbi:hypothetical protein [Streptomyces sp. GQFP]|nr:hypothetical protein [Streptomyces sp. GQFP]
MGRNAVTLSRLFGMPHGQTEGEAAARRNITSELELLTSRAGPE